MDKNYVILENRALLKISGEDRKGFLQGIITNDINKVTPQNAIYACILTPQGKFLFDLFIAEVGEAFLLDVEKPRIEELRKKLSMYKLRSKVEITGDDGYKFIALLGNDSLAGNPGEVKAFGNEGTAYIDPRDAGLGSRIVGKRDKVIELLEREGYARRPYEFYENLRISRGVPASGIELIPEKSFPLQNNLEELRAIDFVKGCYVGQEVTARTKHRGVIRKKLYKLEILEGAPATGDSANLGGKPVGEIKSVGTGKAIGLLEIEEAEKISGGNIITAGNSRLKII